MKHETMTSRERVIRAMNHEPVDRVPIDLGSHMSTGISMFAYWNLREHLGFSTDDIWIPDTAQCLAYVDSDILERFHCDCMLLEPRYTRTDRWRPRGKYSFLLPAGANPQQCDNGDWIISRGDAFMRMPVGGHFFDGSWINDWGEGNEDDRIALYAKEAERIFKETDYATNLVGYSYGLRVASYNGGEIDEAIRAFDDPETVHTEREAMLSDSIRLMGKIIDSFGPYIQLV